MVFSAKGLDKAKKKLEIAKMRGKKRKEYDAYEDSLHSEASYNKQMELNDMLAAKKAKAKAVAEFVIRLHLKDKSAEEIADLVGIDLAQVNEIIAIYTKQ